MSTVTHNNDNPVVASLMQVVRKHIDAGETKEARDAYRIARSTAEMFRVATPACPVELKTYTTARMENDNAVARLVNIAVEFNQADDFAEAKRIYDLAGQVADVLQCLRRRVPRIGKETVDDKYYQPVEGGLGLNG